MDYTRYKLYRVNKWEKKFLLETIEKHGWNVSAVARYLELDRANLLRLMRKHGINRAPLSKEALFVKED